jgi:molecular chaperone GrpE
MTERSGDAAEAAEADAMAAAEAEETEAEETEAGGASGGEAELRQKVAQTRDQLLRALADADNARKRCATLLSRAEAEATARVAGQWLPVVDNLDRALEHTAGAPPAMVSGVRAVRDQAVSVLAGLGFPRRDDTGAVFDPVRHDAIATRADPAVPEGTVVEVTRPGYGEGDHQLRPAQVVVARAG